MATQERPADDDQPYLERFVWGWAGRTFCGLFIYVFGVGWEIHKLKSADSKNKSADSKHCKTIEFLTRTNQWIQVTLILK